MYTDAHGGANPIDITMKRREVRQPGRIFLVENDGALRRQLVESLNEYGYTHNLCHLRFLLLLADIYSIMGLTAASQVIRMFGKIDIARTIAAAAVFVLVIYGAYFGLTYLESRQFFSKE